MAAILVFQIRHLQWLHDKSSYIEISGREHFHVFYAVLVTKLTRILLEMLKSDSLHYSLSIRVFPPKTMLIPSSLE